MNLLLDAGAEVTTADEEGQTPLLRVSEYGAPADSAKADSATAARRFLEKGADVNVADIEGDTAAILAARAANWWVRRLGVDAGMRRPQIVLLHFTDPRSCFLLP